MVVANSRGIVAAVPKAHETGGASGGGSPNVVSNVVCTGRSFV